jgi:AraC family transcriptional regulator of adaptative response/methylated-DNA-[protein]-cysteine methyltransferase
MTAMNTHSITQKVDTTLDRRWQAVVERDSGFDGQFYYSVRTTGVYCRPSCAARLPRPENVAFHASRTQAEGAGFRPCRRCRPEGPTAAEQRALVVAAACRTIEAADEPPSLDVLAAAAGLSRFYFLRLFKSVAGVTPKAYADAARAQRVRDLLRGDASVTATLYDAGFNSNGRFYAATDGILGMTPTAFRRGGKDALIRFALGECSLGSILVACSDKGICAISLGEDPARLMRELEDRFPNADLVGGDGEFEMVVSRVVGLVEGASTGLDLPLDIRGTAFQRRVWQALREIGSGETVSYAEVARRIAMPKAARAVARACAANALAVVIPCHRVVRNDGAVSGYRWGIERKQALLRREAGL